MSTETFGPVEVYAFAFPHERVPDRVKAAVVDVIASGAVTLLDLLVIRKANDGAVEIVEAEDLGDQIDITDIEIARPGMAGQEDVDDVAAGLPPGTVAVMLVIEHTWSRGFVGELAASGGIVVAAERIPAEVVNELAALAGLSESE